MGHCAYHLRTYSFHVQKFGCASLDRYDPDQTGSNVRHHAKAACFCTHRIAYEFRRPCVEDLVKSDQYLPRYGLAKMVGLFSRDFDIFDVHLQKTSAHFWNL